MSSQVSLSVTMVAALLCVCVQGMGQDTLLMSGVSSYQVLLIMLIILHMQDGQLSHLEENVHILLIIIGVFSALVIGGALLRHCLNKRKMVDTRRTQI